MIFIKSLFKYLLPLLLSATALSESSQYPHIEPIDVPQEILESYRKLVDQSLFPNITDYLLNKARYVTRFYIEGEDFLIPEYAVVINMCIEYLNQFHPRYNGEDYTPRKSGGESDFSVERHIYSLLLQDIENLKNSKESLYNLKYSDVLHFLVKTALIRSEAMVSPSQKVLFKYLINNNGSLNMNHLFVRDYHTQYARLGVNSSGVMPTHYSEENITLLQNILKPVNWMLPNQKPITSYTIKKNNLFDLVFYFIHVSDNQTNRDFLDFPEFRRIEGSHFLHVPSVSALKSKGYKNLWDYLLHDLFHLKNFIEYTLPEELLVILNSPNKEDLLIKYLEKQAILQGSMWNSLDEFFQDPTSQSLATKIEDSKAFVLSFFNAQQEASSYFVHFSATCYKTIFNHLAQFYKLYKTDFKDEKISLKDFTNSVKSRFNKHLEKNYPQYLSEHFLP